MRLALSEVGSRDVELFCQDGIVVSNTQIYIRHKETYVRNKQTNSRHKETYIRHKETALWLVTH